MSTPAFEFYPDGLQWAEGVTHAETKHIFRLFFLNKPELARTRFSQYDHIPFFAMGKSAVLFLWALLTLDDGDVRSALDCFQDTEALARAQLKRLKAEAGGGGWFGSAAAASPTPSSDQLHGQPKGPAPPGDSPIVHVGREAELVFYGTLEAQCLLLTAMLGFVSGGVMEKLKSAITLRSVWQKYSKLQKASEAADAAGQHPLAETSAMLEFGIGAFNTIVSILPPRFVRVASFFGFPSSRSLGLQLLRKAFERDGAASPLAGCLLLTHHTMLQTSYLYGTTRFREEAMDLAVLSQRLFPGSGWFLLLTGRLAKLMRDQQRATELFEQSMHAQAEWKPLRDMCLYELGAVHLSAYRFEESLQAWHTLREENDWSVTYYTFMSGVCELQMGRHDDALRSFRRVKSEKSLEIQGKKLPVDLWSRRKVARYVTGDTIDMPLIHLEMLLLLAAFHMMPAELLQRGLDEVQHVLAARGNEKTTDIVAVGKLLEGALLIQLGRAGEAEAALEAVDAMKKDVQDEVWAIYYARYELAMLWHQLDGGGSERVLQQLARAYARKDHNFDIILHVRINMAQYHAKHAEELQLDTGGTHPRPLVPVAGRDAIANEYAALEVKASAKLDAIEGPLGEALVSAREETKTAAAVEESNASIDHNAIWWRGVDEPAKVTAV